MAGHKENSSSELKSETHHKIIKGNVKAQRDEKLDEESKASKEAFFKQQNMPGDSAKKCTNQENVDKIEGQNEPKNTHVTTKKLVSAPIASPSLIAVKSRNRDIESLEGETALSLRKGALKIV